MRQTIAKALPALTLPPNPTKCSRTPRNLARQNPVDGPAAALYHAVVFPAVGDRDMRQGSGTRIQ